MAGAALTHSRCGGSVLARRITCTASLLLEEALPEDAAGGAAREAIAREGSRAHALLDACLASGLDAAEYLPDAGGADGVLDAEAHGVLDEDMVLHVQTALDEIGAVVPPERRGEIISELTVDLSTFVPDPEGAVGTVDTAWHDAEHATLYVWDLKYGYYRVPGKGNVQTRAYALGLIEYLDGWFDIRPETIDMTILQPRLGVAPSWDRISREDLIAWGQETVAPKIEEALDPARRAFAPSVDNCRYCRARATCRARASLDKVTSASLASIVAGDAHRYRDVELFSDEEIVALAPHLDDIETWARDARAHLSRRVLDRDLLVPGYGHVTGLSNRAWRAEVTSETLRRTLGLSDAALHERRLLGPAAVERLLPKRKAAPELHAKFAELVTRVPLAPKFRRVSKEDVVDDPREGFGGAGSSVD